MRILNKPGNTLLSLIACIGIGIATTLWAAQAIWIEANKVRLNSYAKSLLIHAENVAESLTNVLTVLNENYVHDCSAENLNILKDTLFQHSYLRDVGIINNNKISCTAIWGKLKQEYTILEQGHQTRNNITLWHNIPSYLYPSNKMDISAKDGLFVVTSRDAFSAFEASTSISANITSSDRSIVMRKFGDQTIFQPEPMPFEVCSKRFDLCVNATIRNSIFTSDKLSIIATLTIAGAGLGLLLWYSLIHYLRNKNTMAARLTNAIEKDRISLMYQPIVDANSSNICGFEALARWNDRLEGKVSPEIFVRLAEEFNLSTALSKSITTRAITECAAILHSHPQLYLSLNLSTSDLISDDMLTHLVDACSANGICSSQIAIELLETSTTNLESLQNRIQDYRNSGYMIFIDDFGTGYSSLAYLSHLDIDKIKIDKTFTQSVGSAASADIILTQINEIARSIGAKVIYEGIETEEQRQAILSLNGQAFAQGWLFSKAIPIDQLLTKINSAKSDTI
ncbi:EAL domain-containing protein [Pseudomonas monteilii]|uniref:EAL domain-containing protein n=1 Tax=Pseudomonas monteilii TaxID=76759 RepID=UPI003806306C